MNNIIIAKFGSELVTNGTGVDQERINSYTKGLLKSYQPSQLIIVTSGAVNAGRARLAGFGGGHSDVTLSQLGAASIVAAWELAFAAQGVLAGGLLVTHNELKDPKEGPQFLEALQLALNDNVVSIINENDALSDTELMKLAVGGDNDGLAAHIASLLSAEKLLLFTKKGGVIDEAGSIVKVVNGENAGKLESMLEERSAQTSSDTVGRGGMLSKFKAARRATEAGVETIIARPSTDMQGEMITKFVVG